MLDEAFRRRVADVASADASTLGADAEARVLRQIALSGPGLVRRGRRARVIGIAAGPLLAAAAALALIAVRHERAGSSPVVVAARGAPAALACASRAESSGARMGFETTGDYSRLDLGAVAVAVSGSGAVVRLSEASSCRTILSLDAGTVTVHAKDLGGGELRVHAPGGEVIVHGTIFAVTQTADAFSVEVAEGRVSVTDRLGAQTVSTGGRLLVSAVGVAEGALSAERLRAMRAVIGAPEVVGLDTLQPFRQDLPSAPAEQLAAPIRPQPDVRPPSPQQGARAESGSAPAVGSVGQGTDGVTALDRAPADPLALAEEARRAGDFARARELYRRAGDGSGVAAEAAWVALARLELSLGHTTAAREATKRRQERFGQGTLGPEALWIDVRSYRQSGDQGRARELASDLLHRWPSSPQALAARQWLSAE